jgi:L-aminopeptidase/D-esterase-like protein
VSTDLVATDDALREASVRRIATLASVGAAISLSLAVTALSGALDDGSAPQTALSAVLLVSLLAIVAVLALAKRRTFTAARLDRTRS